MRVGRGMSSSATASAVSVPSASSCRTQMRGTIAKPTSSRTNCLTFSNYQPQAPPAKFVFAERGRRSGEALDSVISPGCIISGSLVVGSVLCPNVRVHSYGSIDRCILMPGVRVGRHARIRRAIIDRDVLIPRGAVIGFNLEEDRKRHTVTDLGVVIVTEDDDPLVEPIGDEALRIEAEDDGR